MFNNSSVNELYNLIEPLFYDDLTLADVVLTITAEKKVNEKVTPKGTWYLAQFEYTAADPADVTTLREYAQKNPVFRADTLTPTAVYSILSEIFAYGLQLPQPAPGVDSPIAQLEAPKQAA